MLEGVCAEILGVDLTALNETEDKAIRDAFSEHGVIFFANRA